MQSRRVVVLATLLCAVALMAMTTAPAMAQLPDGVSLKILAEFPSNLPGIEKVQLQEFRVEPGAKWEGGVVGSTGF